MKYWLEIERVASKAEDLCERVTPAEWAEGEKMLSPVRRAEWLTWRAIVRRRLGRDATITYAPSGAPKIEDGYISVSHTQGWVAVLWSPEPCAVDIEPTSRRLPPSVAARYGISSMEDWCAREAAYKYTSVTGGAPPPCAVRFVPHPDLVVAVIASGGL